MPGRLASTWLPWLFFWLTLGMAGALLGAVVLAPLLEPVLAPAQGASRLVALFAHDATLRRTALASAVGLTVTACVFFLGPQTPGRHSKLPPANVGA